MKQFFISLLACATICVGISSCIVVDASDSSSIISKKTLTGSDKKIAPKKTLTPSDRRIVSKSYSANVTKIKSSCITAINIKKSPTGKITVHAPKWIMDITDVSIKNGVLNIKYASSEDTQNKSREDCQVAIEIEQPELSKITIDGVSAINGGGNFSQSDIVFDLNGVANLQITQLKCNSLKINYNGVGNADISGNAATANFQINGKASISAFDFKCVDVIADVNGIGDIECFASSSLNADVNGIGNIYYKGKPVHVTSRTREGKIINRSEIENRSGNKRSARTEKRSEPTKSERKKTLFI